MEQQTRDLFTARANVIKAMAHPTRLFMVDHLSKGAATVSELQQLVAADMSTVSKHLAVLRNQGIVQDQRQGNQIFYTLRFPCVLDFFQCVEKVLHGSATTTLDLMEKKP
jgi:DNA-binding transcriptional ArsR family regulator